MFPSDQVMDGWKNPSMCVATLIYTATLLHYYTSREDVKSMYVTISKLDTVRLGPSRVWQWADLLHLLSTGDILVLLPPFTTPCFCYSV